LRIPAPSAFANRVDGETAAIRLEAYAGRDRETGSAKASTDTR
jgi:hypothetical protein